MAAFKMSHFNNLLGQLDARDYTVLYERYDYIKDIARKPAQNTRALANNSAHIIQLYHKKEKKRVIGKILQIRNHYIDQNEIETFLETEMNIMNKLNHSNIGRFFEFFSDDKRVYQISDYFKSGTLRQLLDKRLHVGRFFTFDEAFSIFIQILDGLAYLNRRNLILEYLNTDDIYIQNGKLKITNFGNEARKFRLKNLTSNQKLESRIQRRFYTPPERSRTAPLTIKFDSWCLGCLLYEICTLRTTNNTFRINQAIELSPLYTRHEAFFKNSLRDLMEENPEKRISTVDLLQRIVNHQTFIYPNANISKENATVIGYEKICDHIWTENMRRNRDKKYDIYISYCAEESEYLQETIDSLLNYFKTVSIKCIENINDTYIEKERNLSVMSNDNINTKDSIQIADDIMSSSMFLVLLTKKYAESTLAKHELTIAKTAVKNFVTFAIEPLEIDELECSVGTFIKSQNVFKAFPYDSDSSFEVQWVWFDNFVKSIELVDRIIHHTTVSPTVPTSVPYPNGDKYDCFISHKWVGDKPSDFVKELYNVLTNVHNLKVWFDNNEIAYGDNLLSKMQKGIQDSTIFLACISNGYDGSVNCKREINYALAITKPIIVLMLDDINIKDLKDPVGLIAANMYSFYAKKKIIDELVNDIKRFLKYHRN